MVLLDKQDKKILAQLKRKPAHISAIALMIGLPRTTVTYRLGRLSRFGYVSRKVDGRRVVWSLRDIRTGSKSHVQIFEGPRLIEAYKQLFDLPRKTVILSVQGAAAVTGEFKHLPDSFIMEAHAMFKRRQISAKGLSNAEGLKIFDDLVLQDKMIRSHLGRSLGIKLFSDRRFTAGGEIMSTPKFLLLTDPGRRRAAVIKDPEITMVVYDVLELLFEFMDGSPSFDINKYLERKI